MGIASIRPTPTLRFGRATRKYKVNRTGRKDSQSQFRQRSIANAEFVSRCLLQCLPRFQHRGGKGRLVWRIGEMLSFQTKRFMLLKTRVVRPTTQKIPRVKLNAGLSRHDLHRPAA